MLGTILGRRPPEYQARPRYYWRVCTKATVTTYPPATYQAVSRQSSNLTPAYLAYLNTMNHQGCFNHKAGVASVRGDTVLCIGSVE